MLLGLLQGLRDMLELITMAIAMLIIPFWIWTPLQANLMLWLITTDYIVSIPLFLAKKFIGREEEKDHLPMSLSVDFWGTIQNATTMVSFNCNEVNDTKLLF